MKTCASRSRQSKLTALPLHWFSVLCLLLLGATGAQANIYYVSGSGGNDANSGTSWATAKATVQAGINAASSGDQVWVAKGAYFEHVTLPPGIAIYGGFNGTETALSQRNWIANVTLLDGGGSGYVVTCSNGSGSAGVDGFTVQHGIAGIAIGNTAPVIANNLVTQNAGETCAGIYATGGGSPVIVGNTITHNHSAGDGGGMLLVFCQQPYVANNIVTHNLSDRNVGGISTFECLDAVVMGNVVTYNDCAKNAAAGITVYNNINHTTATVTHNLVLGNVAHGLQGNGGIEVSGVFNDGSIGTTATVDANLILNNSAANPINDPSTFGGLQVVGCYGEASNNLIVGNHGAYWGGINAYVCNMALLNNTIAFNQATVTGGIGLSQSNATVGNNIIAFNSSGISSDPSSSVTLSHNCVFGNASFAYSGLAPGATDLAANPLFRNPAVGDYHLHPLSSCIDAGDDTLVSAGELDLDGNGRIYGPHVDIGAYEAQPALLKFTLKPSTVAGSLNVIGTLTLDMPAPAGGATIILSNANPAAGVPPRGVTIPAGATSQTFTITTSAVTTPQTGPIIAFYAGESLSAKLTVRPIGVKTFSIKPSKIVGGNGVTGTVTLEAAAGPGDITVSFSSSDPTNVPTPASITIPAGSLTGTVTISTNAVTASETVTITATANSISKSAKLTVTP